MEPISEINDYVQSGLAPEDVETTRLPRSRTSLAQDVQKAVAPVTQGHVLTTNIALIRLAGGIEDAVFLSQLLYWSDRCLRHDRWVWKSAREWKLELGLSRYQVAAITKRLVALGIVETRLKKANGAPTTYYHIRAGQLSSRIQSVVALMRTDGERDSENPLLPIATRPNIGETTNGLPAERTIDCGEPAQSITGSTPELSTQPTGEDMSCAAEGVPVLADIFEKNAGKRQSAGDSLSGKRDSVSSATMLFIKDTLGARGRAAAGRAEAAALVQQALEHYRAQYQRALGHAPLISPGRDAALLKQLLDWDEINGDVSKLNALIDRFLAVRTGWVAGTDYSISVLQRVAQGLVARVEEDTAQKDWAFEEFVDTKVNSGERQLADLRNPTVVAALEDEYRHNEESRK